MNVYLPSHCLTYCVPLPPHFQPVATTRCPFTLRPLSATFPYPPVPHSLSASLLFSLRLTGLHYPPTASLPRYFPHYPPSPSSLSVSLPPSPHHLHASLCTGPIGSHYIDGNDDSVEWRTPSTGASPRPLLIPAAFSERPRPRLGSPWTRRQDGRMHLLLSLVTC